MIKFTNSIKTKKYIIGCTGSTTYIYDLNENLVKTFKDIPYGYTPYVSKCEKFLCIKSTDRRLAFYDLNKLELIRKVLLKDDQPQDGPATFLDNGDFINIQFMNGLVSNIVIYAKETFEEIKRYAYERRYVFTDLEIEKDTIKLLGFERTDEGNDYKEFTLKFDILSSNNISKKEYIKKSNSWNILLNQTINDAAEVEKSLGVDLSYLIDVLKNGK